MRNAYIVPSLLTAACAVAVTAAIRRVTRRSRGNVASDEIWDQAFIDNLFGDREPDSGHGPRIPLDAGAARDHFVRALTESLNGEFVDDDFLGTPEEDLADFTEAESAEAARTSGPSEHPTPLLPAHRTGAYLVGLVAGATPVTRVRPGSPGGGSGVDVLDFADGSSIVVMPGAPEAAILIDAALAMGRPVRLLGTSELGNGYALTFRVDTAAVYALADRVYVRPPG